MMISFYFFSHENGFSEYEVSERFSRGYFEEEAQEVAGRIAALVKRRCQSICLVSGGFRMRWQECRWRNR